MFLWTKDLRVKSSLPGIQLYSAITKNYQNLETLIDINLRRDLLLLPLHRPHHLLQLPLQVHHRLANVDNRLIGYICPRRPFFHKKVKSLAFFSYFRKLGPFPAFQWYVICLFEIVYGRLMGLTFSRLGPLARGAKGPGLVCTSPHRSIRSKGRSTPTIFNIFR